MSEKSRKPRRTALKRKTGQYRRPSILSQDTPAPSGTTQPAQSSQQNTASYSQPQPEQVVIVQRVNNGNGASTILNAITWPFRKVFGAITWLIRIIIGAMIQSVISFIMWTVILVVMFALVGTYCVALLDTNMDYIQALPLTFERIMTFLRTMGGLRETAESIQNAIPTPIPPSNP